MTETKEEKKVVEEAKKISESSIKNDAPKQPDTLLEIQARIEEQKRLNDELEAEQLRAENLRAKQLIGGRSLAGQAEPTEEDEQKKIDEEAKRYVEQWR